MPAIGLKKSLALKTRYTSDRRLDMDYLSLIYYIKERRRSGKSESYEKDKKRVVSCTKGIRSLPGNLDNQVFFSSSFLPLKILYNIFFLVSFFFFSSSSFSRLNFLEFHNLSCLLSHFRSGASYS